MAPVTNAPQEPWFATCPKGLEALLAVELTTLGAISTRETVAGVYFDGPLALAYRACLWSRLANRILRPIANLEAADGDLLYFADRGPYQINELVDKDMTVINLELSQTETRSPEFANNKAELSAQIEKKRCVACATILAKTQKKCHECGSMT